LLDGNLPIVPELFVDPIKSITRKKDIGIFTRGLWRKDFQFGYDIN